MNQIFRSAGWTDDRRRDSSVRDPQATTGTVATVEYDDGNPATIAVPVRRSDPVAAPRPAAANAPTTPLALEPRIASTDYDDGNPGTIVC